MQWIIRESTKRAGISKHVTSHVLRHTYATHLLEMGLDIMSLKEVLGHSDIRTTLIYLPIAQLGRQRTFSHLDKLYEPELMQPAREVADIVQRNKSCLNKITRNAWQLRALYALAACRTALMGGHIDNCANKDCGHIQISYNSCRNRHCPKYQGHKREAWIYKREEELIKASYYHIVFTLPSEFNRYALFKPKLVYGLLFKVAWSVIKDFSANPKFMGAKTGMISILPT